MCWSHKTLVLHEKHPGHDLFNAVCLRFCRSFSFSLFHIKMSMFDTQANEVNVLVLFAGDFAVQNGLQQMLKFFLKSLSSRNLAYA